MTAPPPRPTAEEVAAWRQILDRYAEGCLNPVPDPHDPRDVAAYREASRQLTAEMEAEYPEATAWM